MSPNLWYMNSRVLEGFYKSEVYVAAANRNDAIAVALQAYDHWISEQLRDYGYHRLISDNFPDDEEYIPQAKAKRSEFHEELRRDLKQEPRRGRIDVSS